MDSLFKTSVFFLLLSLIGGCTWLGHNYQVREHLFITGECLTNSNLSFLRASPNGENVVLHNFNGKYHFEFAPQFDTERQTFRNEASYQYWLIPSEKVFDKYGSNKNTIKEDYHKIRKSFKNQEKPYVSTILYNGGLSLVANRDFAGHAAGENLSPYLEEELFGLTKEQADVCLPLPLDYVCMVSDCFSLDLLVPGYELTEARESVPSVSFTLDIPVKTVMYLTWLNDRLVDKDATLTYREDTLRCTFTVKDRLKKKD